MKAIADLLWAVAEAFPGHADLLLIVRLKRDARLDLEDVITGHQRPTCTAWQHRSSKLWAFEAAAAKASDPAAPVGRVTEIENIDFQCDREQELGLDRDH